MKKIFILSILFFSIIGIMTFKAAESAERKPSFFSRFFRTKNFDCANIESAESIKALINLWLDYYKKNKFDFKKNHSNFLNINQKVAKKLAYFYYNSTRKRDFDKIEEFRKTTATLFKSEVYRNLKPKKQLLIQESWRQVEQALIEYCSEHSIGSSKGFYGTELGEAVYQTDLTDFFSGFNSTRLSSQSPDPLSIQSGQEESVGEIKMMPEDISSGE